MKDLRLSFFSLLLGTVLFLPNNCACVGNRVAAQEQPTAPITSASDGLEQTLTVEKVNDLSPRAKSVYAFLLCDQAFRRDDEAALLEVTKLFLELKTPPSLWMEAGLWLLGRKSPLALDFLKAGHECWPTDTSLLMLLAEGLKENGQLEEAITLVRNYLSKHPKAEDATLELALLLVQQKNFAEAEQLLSSLKKSERTPLIDLNLGKALMGLERLEEAVPYLERAKLAMPDLPDAYLELGKVYERLGQLSKAMHNYEGVLKTDFPPKNVLLKLISLALQQKKPELALRYLEDAPKDIPLQLIVADMFIDAKNYLQAANLLKPIAERPDAPVEVYLLLADLTWEHLHDLNSALAWLDKMPETYRKSSNALLLRIHLLARAEQKEQAVSEAKKGKTIFSEEPKFWEAEARILAASGEHEKALKVMREATKKWPNDRN
ncbi:MAG: tetratricopeptide repeat protein, partial [Desulfovibrio sp.]|nr:tetratricopeptide repeat protein [Desulfovibrio sp.]